MNRHQRRATKHVLNGNATIKNGKIVPLPKKKGPPSFDEKLARILAPVAAYYGMKPLGSDGARVSITVHRGRFLILDVRAPRAGEGPEAYAAVVREALEEMS